MEPEVATNFLPRDYKHTGVNFKQNKKTDMISNIYGQMIVK